MHGQFTVCSLLSAGAVCYFSFSPPTLPEPLTHSNQKWSSDARKKMKKEQATQDKKCHCPILSSMHFSFHHYLTLYSSACFPMHKPWNLCLRCITVHNFISWCTRHGPNPLPTWYGHPTRDKYTSTTTNYSIATASISTTSTSRYQ